MEKQLKINASIGFVLLGLSIVSLAANDNAIVKNKAIDPQHKELDTAVYVTKVNDLDMEEGQSEIEVTAGERTLDIECVVRTFVGMGTVDLGKSSRINVTLEPGRTYQLGAKLTQDGECTPTLN
jgi:hypothetical protein